MIVNAPEPSRRGPFLTAEAVVVAHKHSNPSHLTTHTPCLCRSKPQQAGPRSTPMAAKMGTAADTCAEERKSKHSQLVSFQVLLLLL